MRRFTSIALAAVLFNLVAVPAAQAGPETWCPGVIPTWTLHDNGAMPPQSRDPFTVETVGAYWSVVATIGYRTQDSDIVLNPSPADQCNLLAYSDQPQADLADWIAIDNNRTPPGPYVGRLTLDEPGDHELPLQLVQFVAGRQVLVTDSPYQYQPIGGTDPLWFVDIRDVRLERDATYAFTVHGASAMYLLHSDSWDAATWTPTRVGTPPLVVLPNGTPEATGLVHTTEDGWYGALFVRDGRLDTSVWVQVEKIPTTVRPGP